MNGVKGLIKCDCARTSTDLTKILRSENNGIRSVSYSLIFFVSPVLALLFQFGKEHYALRNADKTLSRFKRHCYSHVMWHNLSFRTSTSIEPTNKLSDKDCHKKVFMSAKKLKEIESLLLDLIIFCTDEVQCDQDVIDQLHSIREQIYKLERRIPVDEKNEELSD